MIVSTLVAATLAAAQPAVLPAPGAMAPMDHSKMAPAKAPMKMDCCKDCCDKSKDSAKPAA